MTEYIRMEAIMQNGYWHVLHTDKQGVTSITPYGWSDINCANQYIVAHGLEPTELVEPAISISLLSKYSSFVEAKMNTSDKDL